MTPPSASTKAAAAAAFLAVVGGLVAGTVLMNKNPTGNEVTTGTAPTGVPTANIKCLVTTALSSPAATRLFKLNDNGKSQYAQVRVCAEVVDGQTFAPSLPSGMQTIPETQVEVPYEGGAMITATLQGEAQFPCACSPGVTSTCESKDTPDGAWHAAPLGLTLAAGLWRGDCEPKVCVEVAGTGSMPEECPVQ